MALERSSDMFLLAINDIHTQSGFVNHVHSMVANFTMTCTFLHTDMGHTILLFLSPSLPPSLFFLSLASLLFSLRVCLKHQAISELRAVLG